MRNKMFSMELPPLSLRSFKCPFLLGPWPRHESDIPVKEIKENIFSEFIFHNFNNSVFAATFSSELKYPEVIRVFLKNDWITLKTIAQ